jgi:CRISPR/Cas system-associated exonuclease Cas4 (RecB family)
MWSDCPRQWKLTYVDKVLPGEDSIHSVFGSAMHDTIQQWLDILFNKSKLIARTMDLSDPLKDNLIKRFGQSIVEENGQKLFVCDKQTLMEFYDDGCKILKYLQSHVDKFFPTVEWSLEGVEIPLILKVRDKLQFRGYIDIILRHKVTGVIKIIDLKTSTKGWNKWAKKDKSKTNQILLYKRYYAEKFGVDENIIGVEFLILKRKLFEGTPYAIPRVSPFVPAHKKASVKTAIDEFEAFLDEASVIYAEPSAEVKATPSKSACRFCPYNKTEHCSEGVWDG